MTTIAIDPGKSGGIAVQTRGSYYADSMPETIGDIVDYLRDIEGEKVAYLEHVQGFAGKGRPGSHMFGLGENFGAIQGILAALGIKTVLVRPQKWQKFYGLGTRSACKSDSQWKNKLKAEAQRLFPTVKVTLANADALLLLNYAPEEGKR